LRRCITPLKPQNVAENVAPSRRGGAGRHAPHRGYIGLVGLDGVLGV